MPFSKPGIITNQQPSHSMTASTMLSLAIRNQVPSDPGFDRYGLA